MALLPSLIFHSAETKNYWQLSDGESQALRKFLRKVSRQVPVELKIMKKIILSALLSGVVFSATTSSLFSQTVEKVADLSFYLGSIDFEGHGGYAPLDGFTQVGTNLWFTTSKGGYYDLGTISRFDLTTHQVVEVASLNSASTGSRPESPLLVIGEEAYFTTQSTGVSNKGTIAKINLTSGVITPLFAFPFNGLATGTTPRGGLTLIGNDLWTTTSLGGSAGRGVVLKYNLTSGSATLVTNLDGPLLGGQAFDGFSSFPQSGNAWYYTTFTGGSTFNTTNYPILTFSDNSTAILTNKLPLGAGTLGRLTFDGLGNPVFTVLKSVPGGSEEFPAIAPTLVGTNSLYFSSTGPNSLPGAILRYDLSTGYFTNLFSFSTNPIPQALYGTRPGYCTFTEWQGELYFLNRNGGTNATGPNSGGGTVAKFNIASNTVIKLADLGDPVPANNIGSFSGGVSARGCIVQETNRFYIYYPLVSGGINSTTNATGGLGTIIRVLLPPPPIQASVAVTGSATNTLLSWSGGYPPFDVLTNGDFSTASTNWAAAITNITADVNTTNWSVTLPVAGASTFYRVRGQAR